MVSAPVLPTTPCAYIDLSALAHNYGEVRRLLSAGTEVLAMVKADAYGHGAIAVTQTLSELGCKRFGVATLDEAEALAPALTPGSPVVVFGGLLEDDAARAVGLGVEPVVYDLAAAEALAARGRAAGFEVRVHVKIDTGMRRLGVAPEQAAEFVGRLAALTGIRVVALCSHFAMAESVTTPVTRGQLERMLAAAAAVEPIAGRLPLHLANSAAIMTRHEAHLDIVRPGLMLYGLLPDPALAGKASLQPVMTLEAPVVRVAEVGPDEGIGYGHSFRTGGNMRVATLRCGYADGYPRALSNRGEVMIAGSRRPVIGRVCMDHMMVDVTGLDVSSGDRAIVWGGRIDTGELAARAGTISYELVARVGTRVRRVYRKE